MAIVKRTVKGEPLTHQEVDDNFQELQDNINANGVTLQNSINTVQGNVTTLSDQINYMGPPVEYFIDGQPIRQNGNFLRQVDLPRVNEPGFMVLTFEQGEQYRVVLDVTP